MFCLLFTLSLDCFSAACFSLFQCGSDRVDIKLWNVRRRSCTAHLRAGSLARRIHGERFRRGEATDGRSGRPGRKHQNRCRMKSDASRSIERPARAERHGNRDR